ELVRGNLQDCQSRLQTINFLVEGLHRGVGLIQSSQTGTRSPVQFFAAINAGSSSPRYSSFVVVRGAAPWIAWRMRAMTSFQYRSACGCRWKTIRNVEEVGDASGTI